MAGPSSSTLSELQEQLDKFRRLAAKELSKEAACNRELVALYQKERELLRAEIDRQTSGLSTLEKPKTIYLADMTDSGLLVDPRRMTFENADDFKQFLTRSGVGALIDVTEDRDPTSDAIVTRFSQIQSMHTYVEKVFLEFMVMMHPILRPDLRILKEGKQSAQEVDLVLFDGAHKAVIGEHKSHVKSRQPVDKLVKTAEKLRQRAEEGMGKYREFQNRKIGLAFMAESVAPSAEQSVERACRDNGIAIFRRSGMAIGLGKPGMPPGRGFIKFT